MSLHYSSTSSNRSTTSSIRAAAAAAARREEAAAERAAAAEWVARITLVELAMAHAAEAAHQARETDRRDTLRGLPLAAGGLVPRVRAALAA